MTPDKSRVITVCIDVTLRAEGCESEFSSMRFVRLAEDRGSAREQVLAAHRQFDEAFQAALDDLNEVLEP